MIFFMIFSGFFATTMHCLIRFATEDHHPFEVAFFRTIFVLIIFLPLVARNGISSLKSNNIKLQTFRAIVGSVAMLCMFYGLSITELAKATALMFTVPIFATILAILFLCYSYCTLNFILISSGFSSPSKVKQFII